MSQVAVAARGRTAMRGRLGTEAPSAPVRPDTRRALQLGLAAVWLLDGVLQYQPFMYTKATRPSWRARSPGTRPWLSITWSC
jgi:hypothetical protein